MTSATAVFKFIESHPEPEYECHEIYSEKFAILRRSVRTMSLMLMESDDEGDREIASGLRLALFGWLSSPARFDLTTQTALNLLGSANDILRRWGGDMLKEYKRAFSASQALSTSESPLRIKVANLLDSFYLSGKEYRIICQRSLAADFASLPISRPLAEGAFLHTSRDYRESAPFDVLLKVGPLRGKGWGAIPDAILTAPRYSHLIHVLWHGSRNEPGFGYDPTRVLQPSTTDTPDSLSSEMRSRGWKVGTKSTNAEILGEDIFQDIDDFEMLSTSGRQDANRIRQAVFVQTDDHHGILCPPFSRMLSFDPATTRENRIDHRIPCESLGEGMLLVISSLGNDLGHDTRAHHGHFSRIWKARLRAQMTDDLHGLLPALKRAGIDLINLHLALEHWSKDPTTVIHAPQKKAHFEILLRIIKVPLDKNTSLESWTRRAWNEIARSRGEAILGGMADHDEMEATLIHFLKSTSDEIAAMAANEVQFSLALPEETGLQGHAMFLRVLSIEKGFMPPESELKVIRELDGIEQWRA